MKTAGTSVVDSGLSHLKHWLESQLLYFQSSSLLLCLGRQQKMALVLGSLTRMWEPWIDSWSSRFSMVQVWLSWALGREQGNGSVLSHPSMYLFCHSDFQINK